GASATTPGRDTNPARMPLQRIFPFSVRTPRARLGPSIPVRAPILARQLISENPFAEMKGAQQTNHERKAFIDRATVVKLLDATPMMKILKRAGLTPWPRLFHNLRASRETELASEWPLHVAAEWIGDTRLVAAKHYLIVRDEDFTRAAAGDAESNARVAQNPAQHAAARSRTEPSQTQEAHEKQGFSRAGAVQCGTVRNGRVGCEGLEPPTSRV